MHDENGSTSFTLLAGIAALFFTSMYVIDGSRKTTQSIVSAKISNSQMVGQNINLSNIAQIKALLSDRKISPDVYEPAIYPQDYFANSWDLRRQGFTAAKVTSITDRIRVPFVVASEKTPEQFQSILMGSSNQIDSFANDYELQIVGKNRNPNFPYYIESIDVEALSNVEVAKNGSLKQVKNRARIPLAAPVPKDVSLWIMGPGMPSFTQNFGTAAAPLPAGSYTLEVRASGVVYYAELNLSGVSHVLGLDPKSGSVLHGARNVKALDAVIGQYALDINPPPAPGSPTISINPTTCEITASPSVAGGSSKGIDFQLTAYGVNGIAAAQAQQTGTLYIATPQLVASEPGRRACQENCSKDGLWASPHVMDPPAWSPMLDDGILQKGDPALRYDDLMTESEQMNKAGVSGAVCVNYDHVGQMLRDSYQMMPSEILAQKGSEFFVEQVRDRMPYRQIYAFIGPSCEKQLIGQRNDCGCFAADTPILMADGSQRPIQDIRPGDFVWNPRTRAPQAVARVIAGPEEKPMYEVGIVGSELLVTEDHPFLTPFGLVQASELKIGMRLLLGEQETIVVKLQAKPIAESPPIVWNLELAGSEHEDDHFVWAAGIMTGDLYLQNSLRKKQKAVP